jgi:A/G-specific adenine glycosylase
MLVQTTAAAVGPYFERFLAKFPRVDDLAAADETEVLKAWEGLGYYRRARALHQAAKAIVEKHGSQVPCDLQQLQDLPGVGRYIAGAVMSFAFDRSAPILEANTQRVLSRLLAWNEDIAKSTSQKRLWQAAGRLVPETEPGLFNQAFLELGATVCTPREPMCLICPVASDCLARARGIQAKLPIKIAKAAPLEVHEACALIARDGKLLVLQRGPGRLWDGFWEFPAIHISGVDPAGRSYGEPVDLIEGVSRLTGVRVRPSDESTVVKFAVTKHKVTLTATRCEDLGGDVVPSAGFSAGRFVSPAELSGLVLGSAMRKIANWGAGLV